MIGSGEFFSQVDPDPFLQNKGPNDKVVLAFLWENGGKSIEYVEENEMYFSEARHIFQKVGQGFWTKTLNNIFLDTDKTLQ